MLFLGTEKYPDENSYSSFLATHGGSSNAFTASETTNYHFEVQAPYLEVLLCHRTRVVAWASACHCVPFAAQRVYFSFLACVVAQETLDRFAQFFIAPLFTESATERELKVCYPNWQPCDFYVEAGGGGGIGAYVHAKRCALGRRCWLLRLSW